MSPQLAPVMDGAAALADLIGEVGVPKFLARHTVFLHPDTVGHMNGEPLFRVVRSSAAMRGQAGKAGAVDVIYCDNNTPTLGFLWAANRSRGRDVQFNHVWTASNDPQSYTALWNMCATPAFLAKLTDGKRQSETTSVLQYRSFELYGHCHGAEPPKPEGYDGITEWADHPEPVVDLKGLLRRRLAARPKTRAALSARTIGWFFSDWEPDPTVGFDPGEERS